MNNELPEFYPGYNDKTKLSPEDEKLLSEIDALDSNGNLAVDFTDDDMIHNSKLLGKMSDIMGSANNVNCASYTYIINVYEKDPVSSTFKATRVFQFKENVSSKLCSLFESNNAVYINRSTTECFGARELYSNGTELEKRAVYVYDLIVPEGFDIDAPQYHYHAAITSFEPWEQLEEHWSTELHDEWADSIPEHKVLKMHPNSPHQLDTREAIPTFEIK